MQKVKKNLKRKRKVTRRAAAVDLAPSNCGYPGALIRLGAMRK